MVGLRKEESDRPPEPNQAWDPGSFWLPSQSAGTC